MSVNFAKANLSDSIVTKWQPEPQTRGTWSILSTCTITTALCVWTAVHLNVPVNNKYRTKLRRRLCWLVIGLFAPEMVAYTAWYQRLAAAHALKDIHTAVGQESEASFLDKAWRRLSGSHATAEERTQNDASTTADNAAQSKERLCMAHAFYACMGGIRLDISGLGKPILPPSHEIVVLTPKGVAVMLKVRPQLLQDLPLVEILDKSKASPIAKALVCWQASWFCLQCLGRLLQSVPVSLLELNTFAHCVFALIIYIQWWDKPQDVDTASVIRGDNARELVAWMSMYTPMDELGISKEHRVEARRIRTLQKEDRIAQNVSTIRIESRAGGFRPDKEGRDQQKRKGHTMEATATDPYPSDCITLLDGDELLSTGLCYYDEADASPYWPSWGVTLTPMDIERWKCAARLFKENPPSGIWIEFEGLLSSKIEVSDWPPLFGRKVYNARSIWVLFMVAGFLYGGLHAMPWNTHFRSATEQILWRLSTSIVIAFGPLTFLAYWSMMLFGFIIDHRASIRSRCGEWANSFKVQSVQARALQKTTSRPLRVLSGITRTFAEYILVVLWLLAPVTGLSLIAAYGFARVFLIVECFLSLSYSDPAVFQVPSWSAYFPHIA